MQGELTTAWSRGDPGETCRLQGMECHGLILNQGRARVRSEFEEAPVPLQISEPRSAPTFPRQERPRTASRYCPLLPAGPRAQAPSHLCPPRGEPCLRQSGPAAQAPPPGRATTTPGLPQIPRSPSHPEKKDVNVPALSTLFSSPLFHFPHLRPAILLCPFP